MIRAYLPEMVDDVAACYNRIVAGVPHCYPVGAEQLADLLPDALHPGAGPEMALVWANATSVRGIIHLTLAPAEQGESHPQGIIRFFAYDRGYRWAGQALLDAAGIYWREHGVKEVLAFHRKHNWPFYHVQHVHLSAHLAQVEALLGLNGFRRGGCEINLDWRDLPTVTPDPIDEGIEVWIRWEPGSIARPGLRVLAHRGEGEIGECVCCSLGERSPAAARLPAADAQDWLYTLWLGVAESERGRSLGRHLLQRALAEMRGVGYKHATICTTADNYPACLLYSNLGYRTVDWTWSWTLSMEES